MTAEQIKARLENHAASLAEREARQRIADEAFRRAERNSRNVSALIVVGVLGFVASLLALVYLAVRG